MQNFHFLLTYYAENGIACDKFFDVSDGMSIETDEQIDNALLTIEKIDKNRIVQLKLTLLEEEDEEEKEEEKHD